MTEEIGASVSVETVSRSGGRRALKIAVIVLLELVLLAAGLFAGFLYGRATAPQAEIPAEYMTIEAIREYYEPSAADAEKSVAEFVADGDYYGLFGRVYHTLLMQTDVYMRSSGYTDSLNTVKVIIESEKKLGGGFMHWAMRSTGDSMADKTTFTLDGYFNIEEKFVKIKRYDNKGNGEEKNGKEQSELAYIAKYGLLPFAFSNYSVTEETLLSAVLKEEEGLYALELELDPVGATEGYAVQMRGMSGQNAAFDGGSVLYTLYFGEDFILRKTNTREKYFIDYGFSIACDAVMDEEYFYSGEEGFSALTEEEKYENILPDDR